MASSLSKCTDAVSDYMGTKSIPISDWELFRTPVLTAMLTGAAGSEALQLFHPGLTYYPATFFMSWICHQFYLCYRRDRDNQHKKEDQNQSEFYIASLSNFVACVGGVAAMATMAAPAVGMITGVWAAACIRLIDTMIKACRDDLAVKDAHKPYIHNIDMLAATMGVFIAFAPVPASLIFAFIGWGVCADNCYVRDAEKNNKPIDSLEIGLYLPAAILLPLLAPLLTTGFFSVLTWGVGLGLIPSVIREFSTKYMSSSSCSCTFFRNQQQIQVTQQDPVVVRIAPPKVRLSSERLDSSVRTPLLELGRV